MGKKLTLLFAIFTVILSVIIPNYVSKSISNCFYALPKEQMYSNNVYCNGIIASKNSSEVFMSCPVITQDVFVKIGDNVSKGDKIADINVKATENYVKNSVKLLDFTQIIEKIPPNYVKIIEDNYNISLSKLMDKNFAQEFSQGAELLARLQGLIDIPNEIIASSSGVISELNIESNHLFNGGRLVAKILDLDSLEAILDVAEEDIQKIKVGDEVILKLVSNQASSIYGKVSFIYPSAETQRLSLNPKSTVKLKVQIQNSSKELKPNFNVSAKIKTGAEKRIITLPYSAIFEDEINNEYIYILKNGLAQKRYIKTGTELLNDVEICEGLFPDEIVLISEKIKNGQRVKIKGEYAYDS